VILGLICARYHSVGLPGKNWRPMHGTPLIEYAIEKAMASICDEVMVSTDIPRPVWSYAVQRIDRPEHLCGPEVAKWDVWKHARSVTGAEVVVDIDVTRPLTTAEDIDGCIDELMVDQWPAVMAVAPASKHPAFDALVQGHDGLEPFGGRNSYTARQQLSGAFLHGGVYAVTARALRDWPSMWGGPWWGWPIPRERAFDIDDETDWKIVEMLMGERLAIR
jgi:N-acylneuraminate cytidylyltransferase